MEKISDNLETGIKVTGVILIGLFLMFSLFFVSMFLFNPQIASNTLKSGLNKGNPLILLEFALFIGFIIISIIGSIIYGSLTGLAYLLKFLNNRKNKN